MLSHFNLHSNALQGEAWMPGAQPREEIFYAVLPMFHAFGMTMYLTFGVRKQGLLVLFPKFDPDLILAAMKKSPVTIFSAVPPVYERTVLAAREKGISLRSAKYCISGAMNLPVDVAQLWESVAGGPLVEGYGMTETSPVALGNPLHTTRKPGTIGLPFPSTLIKVVKLGNPEIEVAQGEPGELLVKGPQVFSGLLEQPRGNRRGAASRRMAAHRGRGDGGCRRIRDDRGPGQGTDHHRRIQRLADRGRIGASPAP